MADLIGEPTLAEAILDRIISKPTAGNSAATAGAKKQAPQTVAA